jgi:hypothetical protein
VIGRTALGLTDVMPRANLLIATSVVALAGLVASMVTIALVGGGELAAFRAAFGKPRPPQPERQGVPGS